MKLTCPRHPGVVGHNVFLTLALVREERLVDSDGEFIKAFDTQIDVTPADGTFNSEGGYGEFHCRACAETDSPKNSLAVVTGD